MASFYLTTIELTREAYGEAYAFNLIRVLIGVAIAWVILTICQKILERRFRMRFYRRETNLDDIPEETVGICTELWEEAIDELV